MICGRCLLRTAPAWASANRIAVRRLPILPSRAFSLSTSRSTPDPESTSKPATPSSSPSTSPEAESLPDSEPPVFTSPYGDGPIDAATILKAPKSACLAGTPLEGLNYHQGRQEPVALPDDQYPEWLWSILDRTEKEVGTGDAGAFSKSKKERKAAAKTARLREEEAIASGNLDALAPKIPFQHQSINLPGSENGTIAEAIEAAQAREKLRRAMRKERMVKIREQNYLSTL